MVEEVAMGMVSAQTEPNRLLGSNINKPFGLVSNIGLLVSNIVVLA